MVLGPGQMIQLDACLCVSRVISPVFDASLRYSEHNLLSTAAPLLGAPAEVTKHIGCLLLLILTSTFTYQPSGHHATPDAEKSEPQLVSHMIVGQHRLRVGRGGGMASLSK